MSFRECKKCHTKNDPDARFCKNPDCEEYLWDQPQEPDPLPPPRPVDPVDTLSPLPDRREWGAVFERGSAQIELRVHNPSEIVDEYEVRLVDAPPWLKIAQTDARVMPGESDAVVVTFIQKPDVRVSAQTLQVEIRIHSTRDESKFAEGQVTLTVPPYGPPATITAHPNVVRVEEGAEGRTRIVVDNRSSNVERFIQLSGSDPDGLVLFRMAPQRLTVPAGETAAADVSFRLPDLRGEEGHAWEVTITASNTQDRNEKPAEVAVTVNQQAMPLSLALEPKLVRVRDQVSSGLRVIVDNRNSKRDRQIRLRGADPEGAVRFAFEREDMIIRAGQSITVGVSISATSPPAGKELTRPFIVIAQEGDKNVEVAGSFVQATSDSAIKKAKVQLTPEVLSVGNAGTGLYRVLIENEDEQQWLQVAMQGSDREQVVRFTFSPDRFRIEPNGRSWGWVRVWAPPPTSAPQLTREFWVHASDGDDSVAGGAKLVQSKSNAWLTFWAWILIVVGVPACAIFVGIPMVVIGVLILNRQRLASKPPKELTSG
jgi:hypothetical protein